MQISLIAGLVLREGERTIELVRQLNDDDFQFEDCLTRRPFVIKRLTILKRIWNRTYKLVVPQSSENVQSAKDVSQEIRIDINSLRDDQKKEIERRLAYVAALQKAHVTRGQRNRIGVIVPKVAKRLKDKKPPSPSTVMEWARRYQTSNLNPLALRNGNNHRVRNRRTHPMMDQLVSEKIRKVYLTRARHTLQHTLNQIRIAAEKLVEQKKLKAEETSYSLASLSRRVREIDLYRRIAAREGHARARMVCRTVMDGAGALFPLHRVEIDHTPLNWVVICDRTGLPLGRPLLTVVIDSFSNYVLGIYLSFYGPGLSSVSGVLRNAIIPKDDFVAGVRLTNRWAAFGVPDEIFVDNGLEFHARIFKNMAWNLCSDLTFCRVRTPWLKPHVERFFATLDYLSLVRGRVHKRVANVMNLDPRKDAAIKFSDLVKGLIMFVTDVYPFEINERKLARPYDLYQEGMESCPPAAFPLDMDGLRLTTALSKELTVGPGGVELLGLPYGREELLPLHQRYGARFKTLVKWDPDDLDYLWIQDPKEKTWIDSPCRWRDYAAGKSWNQHQIIRKFARSELKLAGAYEDLMAAQQRLHEHWMDATSQKTSADSKLAAKFSGVTSARVMATEESSIVHRAAGKTVANEEVVPEEREIPNFETFEMA
jgi:putative transposase